jgi:hypothetical protein
MRGFGALVLVVVSLQTGWSQSYPRWFLEQGSLDCGLTAVGYSTKGYYSDSSASQASRAARQNLVRQRESVVTGAQAFWTTEAGTAWMGSDLAVSVDTAALEVAAADTGVAQIFFGEDMVVALVASNRAGPADSMNRLIAMPADEPEWVRVTQNSGTRIFAVGVAPKYFYESSSWEAAEHMAMLGLAREGSDSVIAMEKNIPGSGQAVLNQNFSVVLRGYSTVARWFDARNQVFYVLMQIDRANILKPGGG